MTEFRKGKPEYLTSDQLVAETLATDLSIVKFMSTARPCPFCGSSELKTTDWWDDDGEFIAIACTGCKAEAPATTWNRRTQE